MGFAAPKRGFQIVIGTGLLITITVTAAGLAGFFVFRAVTQRTETADRERSTETAVYDADCPYDSREDPVNVASVQQMIAESSGERRYQIGREIKESAYRADFTGDGDTDDVIPPVAREDMISTNNDAALGSADGGVWQRSSTLPDGTQAVLIPAGQKLPSGTSIVLYRQEKCWKTQTR